MQHGAERDECGRGGPEQDQRERIQLVSQESHDRLRRPFARQEGRRRAAQQNDEVQQVAEAFRAGQLFGSDDAEQQDHAAGGPKRDDRQQIARASSRENVDEYQRHRTAEHRRQDQHRHDRDDRVEREQHTPLKDDAVRGQNRYRHERHHPGRVQQRLPQFREVQAQPIDRRRDEEVEVLGEEKARQRRDDVGEHEDRDKRQEDESEDLSGNQRSELLDRTQALQDLEQHTEDARPEQASDDRQDDELAGAAAGALLTQPLERGPPFGLQDVGERRLLHAPRTSTKSRT